MKALTKTFPAMPGEPAVRANISPPGQACLAVARPQEPRLLSFWLARYPPGWISQYSAEQADPIALATKVQRLAAAFADWLNLPRDERWDTFTLQALSAALFNRYRVELSGRPSGVLPESVTLLQLRWPPGSFAIQRQVAELQQLLVAPFAIFKAIRVAVAAEEFPTRQEIRRAEEMIVALREDVRSLARRLGEALDQYAAANPGGTASKERIPRAG